MTEESTIQCEHCGTIYSNLEEVCPYCGRPPADYSGSDPAFEDTPYPYLPAQDEFPAGLPPDEAYLPDDAGLYPGEGYPEPAQDPFEDDDIFAVAPAELPEDEYPAAYDEVGQPYFEEEAPADGLDEIEAPVEARRFSRRRLAFGCLGVLLCAVLFYGGIGLLGMYHGLQERTQLNQAEAEMHYQKGLDHLANNSLELAIAEFELALSLNPNFLAAREALADAQRLSLAQPTPTSETRSAAAASILATAEAQLEQENWAQAAESLAQVRGLDPDYRPGHVSEMVYLANYRLGLQLTSPDQIEQAIAAFEAALAEQPDNPEATLQLNKALAYVEGRQAEETDKEAAIRAYSRLYREDSDYLDVAQRLAQTYQAWGDELLARQEWCQAKAQFTEAARLDSGSGLEAKIELSSARCSKEPAAAQATRTPPPPAGTDVPAAAASNAAATAVLTSTTAPAGSGTIYFSAYNFNQTSWEILAVPAAGGTPQVVVANATMPALSPNGRWLVYHSELLEAEGFHIFDMTSGEDRRITIFKQHVLPRWGGDSDRFLFVAQEPATGLWKIQLGFADGKSDPIILRDGRTPDWSPDNRLIAYQGADPQGNNPGIYLAPFDGGEATRLTNHESDRSPDFSPDGTQLAYMSTRGGNWDIYLVNTAGSMPRQLTTGPGNDGLPVWSPDGTRIAYVSDAGGSWAIYTINAEGNGPPTRLTDWDGANRPDWLLAQIWWSR